MEDAEPVHRVEVKGFWIDRTDVTPGAHGKGDAATGTNHLGFRCDHAQ